MKSLEPIKKEKSLWRQLVVLLMRVISFLLWGLLIFTSIHILRYYIHCIKVKNHFDDETMKYTIMILVGAYLFLIVDKNKIAEILGLKKDLPPLEQTEINNKEKNE